MEFLTKITHHLPWFIRDPAVAVLGTECYTSLVYNVDLADTQCLRYAVSKGLGLGIVIGGGIVKVPQIIKIVRARSARGVSLPGYLLDTAGLLLVVGYNYRSGFPFSTYGENCFLLLQNLIIVALLLLLSRHRRGPVLALASLLTSACLLSALVSPSLVPLSLLRTLVAMSIPLALASKVPQILQNHRRGSTGQLSAFLVFNSLAGCLARTFTTATETGDRTMWWSFALAAALNGVLALQMAAFWHSHDPEDRMGGTHAYPLEEATPAVVARGGYGHGHGGENGPGQTGARAHIAPQEPHAIPAVNAVPRLPRAYVRKAE